MTRDMIFIASCHAETLSRNVISAAAAYRNDRAMADAYTAEAHGALVKYADVMGYVVITKAEHIALTGFVEAVRDHRPDVISGRAYDPQDDVDDMMWIGDFYAFQTDAEAIVGRKVKVASNAA